MRVVCIDQCLEIQGRRFRNGVCGIQTSVFLSADKIPSVEWHGSFLVGEKHAKPVYEYLM